MRPDSNPGSGLAKEPQFRRLAISDLLLLALCVGIALAFVAPAIRADSRLPDEMFRGSRVMFIAIPVIDQLGIGFNLFGLAVLVLERLRSREFQPSPGHWYFVIAGPIAIWRLLSELLSESIHGQSPLAAEVIRAIFYLGVGIVAVRGAVLMQSWRWRVCVGLFATSLLILSIRAAYRASEIGGYAGYQYQIHLVAMWGTVAIASCVAAIISVIADFTSGIRRDWLHYGGIVAWLLGAVTIGLVWRRTIARFWLDVYLHVLG